MVDAWDDSALINAFNAAMNKYQEMHTSPHESNRSAGLQDSQCIQKCETSDDVIQDSDKADVSPQEVSQDIQSERETQGTSQKPNAAARGEYTQQWSIYYKQQELQQQCYQLQQQLQQQCDQLQQQLMSDRTDSHEANYSSPSASYQYPYPYVYPHPYPSYYSHYSQDHHPQCFQSCSNPKATSSVKLGQIPCNQSGEKAVAYGAAKTAIQEVLASLPGYGIGEFREPGTEDGHASSSKLSELLLAWFNAGYCTARYLHDKEEGRNDSKNHVTDLKESAQNI